jgi:hypothetical protein
MCVRVCECVCVCVYKPDPAGLARAVFRTRRRGPTTETGPGAGRAANSFAHAEGGAETAAAFAAFFSAFSTFGGFRWFLQGGFGRGDEDNKSDHRI